MKWKLTLSFAIGIISLISCNPQKRYINEALDIIEKHSVKKNEINWSNYRSNVLKLGKNDRSKQDAQETIRRALIMLNDRHSYLLPKQTLIKTYSDSTIGLNRPIVSNFENGIGYIKIPQFIGNDKLRKAYSLNLTNTVKELDKNELKGWIIDLRDNTGGDMWPMVLGIVPILGDGIAGYFFNSENKFIKWGYSDGKGFTGDYINIQADSVYELKNTDKKIAILINENTKSSGEAIALAFKGLPKTRFFGNNTCGLSSANSQFLLSDSAMIVLTVGIFADRNKKVYGKPIIPDEIVKDIDPKEVATKWINSSWTMIH
jgi:carboxyl-terminal processing protease